MPERVYAHVEPELLFWARRSASLELDEAARRAHVRPEALTSWEAGQSKPTIPQLRELARVYKRPLAVFYLPEPPRDFQALPDFRRLQGASSGSVSPELALEMRLAQTRRQIALDLYEPVEGDVPVFGVRAALSQDPEELGARMRAFLEVPLDRQRRWSAGYEAFNGWREAFEAKGVLVFQARHIETSEARGFSISETPLPVVVVNIKDALNGRIFTMLHELAHVALRRSGLCDLSEGYRSASEEQRLEVFCNATAGAVLLPKSALLNDPFVQSHHQMTWTDAELKRLGEIYGVSRDVVLRRLLTLRKTSETFYHDMHEKYERETEARPASRFAPPDRLAISTLGRMFTRLVLQNYSQDLITASDVAEYLGVRMKHLQKIESNVLRKVPA